MSGHNKWSTIKHKKGAADQERGAIFQKLTKELYMAAKNGDTDPNNNSALRLVIEKCKAENMPKSNIESALNKAKNKNNKEDYEAIRYEGYAPSGIALMIDCLTDNKNRTASFVRSTLTKRGGNLGTAGSVSYLFERKGVIVLDKEYNEDKLLEDILECDILDFIKEEEGYTIYTKTSKFIETKEYLESKNYTNYIMSEVTYVPSTCTTLDEEQTNKVLGLIEALEELEDVQNVYHNLQI